MTDPAPRSKSAAGRWIRMLATAAALLLGLGAVPKFALEWIAGTASVLTELMFLSLVPLGVVVLAAAALAGVFALIENR